MVQREPYTKRTYMGIRLYSVYTKKQGTKSFMFDGNVYKQGTIQLGVTSFRGRAFIGGPNRS